MIRHLHVLRRLCRWPLVWAFHLTDQGEVIRGDVESWCRRRYREAGPIADELLELGRTREFRNVFYFRLSRGNGAGRLAALVLRRLLKPVSQLDIACDSIGPGLVIAHGYGTVINAERIGPNLWVHQGVTIGWDYTRGRPTIGENVFIGTGAAVLGPVTVGDGAVIGANAVVTRDVPPGATMVGVPARQVERRQGSAPPSTVAGVPLSADLVDPVA